MGGHTRRVCFLYSPASGRKETFGAGVNGPVELFDTSAKNESATPS
eukprot:SAG22_NODE_455_length_10287_cov_1276.978406_2_plen_46_part_00